MSTELEPHLGNVRHAPIGPELRELLAAAGVDADPGEFRRYGSARRLYTFNVDHAGEY